MQGAEENDGMFKIKLLKNMHANAKVTTTRSNSDKRFNQFFFSLDTG